MLYCLVLALEEGIFDAIFTVLLTNLIMRPSQLTRLPPSLRPLIIHKALQIILQLVIHFATALFDLLLSDEGEVGVLDGHSVGHFEALFLHMFRLDVVVGLRELVHLLELRLLLPLNVLLLQ